MISTSTYRPKWSKPPPVDPDTGTPIPPPRRRVHPSLRRAMDAEAAQLERARRAEAQKDALVALRAAAVHDRRVRVQSAARVLRQIRRDADEQFFVDRVLPPIADRAARPPTASPRPRIQASFGAFASKLPPTAAEEAATSAAVVAKARQAPMSEAPRAPH